MKARPILLTGFEPFGGDTVNPSWRVAQALHGEVIGGVRVQALCLPCIFGQALTVLKDALQQHRPQVVLAMGLAAVRADLSVERVALNVDDARIADNAGAQPIDEPVFAGGPAAYFSTLPIKAITSALQQAGLPAAVSQTAGTFVCNHVFYGLMHQLHQLRRHRTVRAGFMHVPPLSALDLATQVKAARLALWTTLQTAVDLRQSGGSIA